MALSGERLYLLFANNILIDICHVGFTCQVVIGGLSGVVANILATGPLTVNCFANGKLKQKRQLKF